MKKFIDIKGAREHNLRNVSIKLPKDKFIVITGLSGSGKSSLAFDTLYAEGQRRYVESLSAYARQFLGQMKKPDVDSIDGLSPAISIEQKTTSKNPRSTVGTVTEIYDYLRLLWARIGKPFCPVHKIPIEGQSPQKIAERISIDFKGKKIAILAPLIQKKKGTHEKLVKDAFEEGFSRVRIDGDMFKVDDSFKLDRYKMHDIQAVVDRISVNSSNLSRLTEASENAVLKGKGLLMVLDENGVEHLFSAKMACPKCGLIFEELQPRMFSFNSPFGACEECHGLGFTQELDPDLVIPDKSLSIADGAISAYRNVVDGWRGQMLSSVCNHFGFSPLTPINELTKNQLEILLYGSSETFKMKYFSSKSKYESMTQWEGVLPQLDRLYSQTESDWRRGELEKFMRKHPCPVCKGKKLKKKILSVLVGGISIIDLTELSIKEIKSFFDNLLLSSKDSMIAKQVLKEINSRLGFLLDVGLSYLTLSRSSSTLSGGEAQRIRLATQIGSHLTGVLYILDEPSIGLHQHNNHKLIQTLHKLRDLGNTLIVVEHDEDTIRNADYLVDMGPGAGLQGGKVISAGTPKQVARDSKSLTGKYLSGKLSIEVPKERRVGTKFIEIFGACEHNLKNIDVKIPLGVFSVVTGVSGSGKSTLIYDVLYPALKKEIYGSKVKTKLKSLKGVENIDKVIVIDQSPIGRTPRSNPATYTKIFDEIRQTFAALQESKIKGYGPGRFSFNVKSGRCENCSGEGVIKIEMNFLPDVYIECEECHGKKYNKETLAIRYKGKSIADVLAMSVRQALEFFSSFPNLKRKLQTLSDVGLDYIKLGQSSVTLSGGEAQRIKLTRELGKKQTGKTLYLLDEPTTGLHIHDVKKLLDVFSRLVDKGNSILVIEHNLDIIKNADYVIDLGPEGGDGGGKLVCFGTPEEILKCKKSYTADYLRKII